MAVFGPLNQQAECLNALPSSLWRAEKVTPGGRLSI